MSGVGVGGSYPIGDPAPGTRRSRARSRLMLYHTVVYYIIVDVHISYIIHTCVHIYIYIHTYVYIYIYICSCINIYLYIYIHTYIHTYIHMYIYIYNHNMNNNKQINDTRAARALPLAEEGAVLLLVRLSLKGETHNIYRIKF